MKYWENIIKENLTYEEASEQGYFTRPNWDGVHFRNQGNYYILLKDGRVLKNPSYISDKNKNDWINVSVKLSAVATIIKAIEENKTVCDFCSSIADEKPELGSGEETIYKKHETYNIYLEQFYREYAILSNIKYCPYCGGELHDL